MSDASAISPFCGLWILDPASCDYQLGFPPQGGAYRIEDRGDHVRFSIEWIAHDGNHHETAFDGQADGIAHPYPDPNVADALTTTVVDPLTLDTSITKGGLLVAHASRVIADDGRSMEIVQRIRVGAEWKHNTATYRRGVETSGG